MKKWISLLLIAILTGSCAPFVDSPFSDNLLRPERNLNMEALTKLNAIESDGILRFGVYSDSHQNYKETDRMVYQINQEPQLDFVVGLGDFTNSAYNLEYDEFIETLSFIRFPTINVIGNHDSIGAGPELYEKAFGPTNFWIETSNYRLIFFNSNNLETPGLFDPQWLKARVDESSKSVLIFSHVFLRDRDRYFGETAALFGSVIEDPKVKVIFNGHNHVYELIDDHGTVMMQAGRVEADQGTHWLKITIQGNQFCVLRMDTTGNACRTLK